MTDGPAGMAIDAAYDILAVHADGGGCLECRRDWCPTMEWALWMLVVEDSTVRPEARPQVTTVARLVLAAHWPRTVDGCLPCGLPRCDRARIAGTWLNVHDPDFVPPLLRALRKPPTADDLRKITGME